jgi:hypothetical protein
MSLTKRINRIPYGRMLFAGIVGVLIIVLLKTYGKTSTYAVNEKSYAPIVAPIGPSPQGMAPTSPQSDCEMRAGTGLASSLLPREVASQEEFGEFAPEDVLAGQNFLEPRSQIGLPETTGGALRNANQSIRAEPPNPKEAFMWNNSTISTDTMQRPLV